MQFQVHTRGHRPWVTNSNFCRFVVHGSDKFGCSRFEFTKHSAVYGKRRIHPIQRRGAKRSEEIGLFRFLERRRKLPIGYFRF